MKSDLAKKDEVVSEVNEVARRHVTTQVPDM